MSDKKYKYAVKKFAKMLAVHSDKRVTFEDSVDIRNFFSMKIVHGGSWHDSLTQLILGTMQNVDTLQANEFEYWDNLVEHGNLFESNVSVRVLHAEPPFHIRVEFDVPADVLGQWLAATGFPQLSRAKDPAVEN